MKKFSPGITPHSDLLSRVVNLSIVCAGTLLLRNAASSAVWQQTGGAHAAWDTGADLRTITADTCRLSTFSYSICISFLTMKQSTVIRSQCLASGRSSDTLHPEFPVGHLSSPSKPWDRHMLAGRNNVLPERRSNPSTVPQNVLCSQLFKGGPVHFSFPSWQMLKFTK